jgi:hypothetical protein
VRFFQRRKEDFTCEKCGASVTGSGYTNHCPKCLWGKHVDVNPGDRAHMCGGMMEPIRVERQGDTYVLIHRCATCGTEKRNKTAPDDDFEMLLKVQRDQ